ncbi:MAG: DUF1634 domain-containing protein [Bdellovibrio sp.]|nr:DUF1634 domain-containing protein [Bdellovibrio sp.]
MNNDLIQLELFIAKLLRKGVIVAGALILIGWIFSVKFGQNIYEKFHTYQEISLKHSLSALWLAKSWSYLISYAGLIVLISLPILRVIATGFIFLKQRNYPLLLLVLAVLSGLILSIALGFAI